MSQNSKYQRYNFYYHKTRNFCFFEKFFETLPSKTISGRSYHIIETHKMSKSIFSKLFLKKEHYYKKQLSEISDILKYEDDKRISERIGGPCHPASTRFNLRRKSMDQLKNEILY